MQTYYKNFIAQRSINRQRLVKFLLEKVKYRGLEHLTFHKIEPNKQLNK
jgi:hypothetical protein